MGYSMPDKCLGSLRVVFNNTFRGTKITTWLLLKKLGYPTVVVSFITIGKVYFYRTY